MCFFFVFVVMWIGRAERTMLGTRGLETKASKTRASRKKSVKDTKHIGSTFSAHDFSSAFPLANVLATRCFPFFSCNRYKQKKQRNRRGTVDTKNDTRQIRKHTRTQSTTHPTAQRSSMVTPHRGGTPTSATLTWKVSRMRSLIVSSSLTTTARSTRARQMTVWRGWELLHSSTPRRMRTTLLRTLTPLSSLRSMHEMRRGGVSCGVELDWGLRLGVGVGVGQTGE